ncbi:MAG: YhfC family glutamic-type intramembrane protease [Erysipelotrichaceae bacterium]|nr:YhfC family glutamic-type intramembrane protease [Erysipelotrichaceae bacterium]MDD3924745.1 YhfC family glutamic-type intramembrane protease [Erysipelotrichaceae bacterium]MDD4642911.1 YhfC family glutamic-type intramembrane protease [Erysipelotrichaceae bacterium]
MINSLTMFSLYLASITTIVVPVVLIVVGLIYKKLDIVRLLMGMFIFLVLNLFVLNPLLNLVAMLLTDNPILAQAAFTIPLSVLLISIIAVYGRKFSFKYLLPNSHSEKEVVSMAVGLGTGEVIFSMGMMMVSNLYYAIKINNGSIYDILSIEDAEAVISNAQSATFDTVLYYALVALAIIVINIVITYMLVRAKNKNDKRYVLFAVVSLLLFNALIYILPMYNQFILSIITSYIYTGLLAYLAITRKLFVIE